MLWGPVDSMVNKCEPSQSGVTAGELAAVPDHGKTQSSKLPELPQTQSFISYNFYCSKFQVSLQPDQFEFADFGRIWTHLPVARITIQ